MNIKIFAFTAIVLTLGIAGCATTSTTDGSTSGLPGSTSSGTSSGTSTGTSTGTSRGVPESSAGDANRDTKADDGSATTADERKGALEKSLDDSLGEFDKTLDEEQRRTAQARDAQAADRAATESKETGDREGGLGRREGDLRSERSTQAGAGGGDSSSGGRDRGTVSGAGSDAPDRGIPSGDDDDIVARRLRRAAEQETDPELKEKLWKEYMEYKRNAQGRG